MGSIPKWGWIIFLVVAFDDILLWMASPYLAIPVTLLLIAVGGVFAFGGKGLATSMVNNARRMATSRFTQVAAQATGKMMQGGGKSD